MISKKIYLLYALILTLFIGGNFMAQTCPTGPLSLTTSSTPNTCGGNGTITATFVNTPNTSLQLIKGGTTLSEVISPSSPYIWGNLQPGTDYQVKLICTSNPTTVYQTISTTVADNYVVISDADITVTDVCTNFTPGGTIKVNSVTGGSAPYTYSYVLSNDPNYPDASSVYTTSNTYSATQFGTYQIRVKDACGNYKTFTRTIASPLVNLVPYISPSPICGTNQLVGSLQYVQYQSSGQNTSWYPGGANMTIKTDDGTNTVLWSGLYTGQQITYTMSPNHKYIYEITNRCGNTYTLNFDKTTSEIREFLPIVQSTAGCGSAATMVLTGNSNYSMWKPNISVVIKNSVGTTVYTTTLTGSGQTWVTPDLPMDSYTVTYTDACGETLTKSVANPANAGAPTISYSSLMWYCTPNPSSPLTQTGTTQIFISFNGYLEDKQNSTVTIISGPSNVGVQGEYLNGSFFWSNIVPGNYVFRVSTPNCGTTRDFPLTIGNSNILQQSLTSVGTSFCSGGGNIASTRVYNGQYANIVELVNSSGTVVDSNASGNFVNVPSGTYTTRIKVTGCTGNGHQPYYVQGSTVTLTDSSTGPIISSAVGIICEDSSGNALNTGSAYLTLAGVAPYTLDYKLTGTSTWTTINNAPTNAVLTNLVANGVYDVRLSDGCGGTFNSTVVVKTMSNIQTETSSHPCNGQPYNLTVPFYAGATYQWINPNGIVVSNTRTYSIPNYTAAYDGTYTAKVTWGTCVTRNVSVTITSTLCGQPFNFIDAVNDINQTPINVAVRGNVLTNDETTDEPLTVASATFLNASGVEMNLPLGVSTSIFDASGVLAGTIILNGDGSYVYTPALNYIGKVPINYIAKNASGAFDSANLKITVIPKSGGNTDNPIAQNDTSTTQMNFPVTSNVLSNDSDPSGNALNVTAASQGSTTINIGVSTTVSGIDSNGNPIANAGSIVLNANGTYTYTPANGFIGTVNPINYTIKDSYGGSDNANIYISVYPLSGNTTFANDDANSTTKGNSMSGNILTNDFDPNMNIQTVTSATISSVNGIPNGTTVNINGTTTIPNVGTLTLNSNGTYTFVPDPSYVGTVVIPYKICDNESSAQACDDATLYLTVIDLGACYNDPFTGTNGVATKHGITLLKRAGATNGNWPMIRKSAHTVLESNTKGFVITRVQTSELSGITKPVEGMMVYDKDEKCLKIYDGTQWSCFKTPACP